MKLLLLIKEKELWKIQARIRMYQKFKMKRRMWNYFKIININKRYENYVYSFITIYKYSFHINFIKFIIRKFYKMRYL